MITKMFLPLMLLALVLAVSAGEIICVVREREALIRFKQGLIDDYGVLSSWGSEEDCCNWKGVRCSNATGHVTGILLPGYHGYASFLIRGNITYGYDSSILIRGNITSSLLELHFLEHLDLSNNDFGGIVIPRFFGSLENLRILNLRWSGFSGMVPPQLGNLTNLRILDLSRNDIWSENLDWLSHLTLLSELDLGGVNLSDSNWLQQVLKLRSLQQLSLYDCSLQDVTPSSDLFLNSSLLQSLSILDLPKNMLTSSSFDWLFNLSTSLVNIDLSYNQLDGPIPDSFERFPFLEELNLSDNLLTHAIPKSIGSLSHLRILYIIGNDLGESLDGLLGNNSCKVMVSLQEVDLSYNQIGGSIPEVGACSKLKYFDLGNNKLTGPIPSSLGNLSELEYLILSYNSLEGVVSESHFEKLRSLKGLHFSYNSLTLKIPSDWIPPFQLDSIQLASCKLGPFFPSWLQTQTNFTFLDISDAAISDKVPKWLWSLSPEVSYFNISNNQLLGSIPPLTLSLIHGIDASYNHFSGQIPLLHPNTSFIQFSNNFFSGSISSICSVSYKHLALFDLSNNQLFGALPTCWQNMTELDTLDLSNNKLSGEIPESLGSLSNLEILHLQGNNLTGELPASLKNCGQIQSIDIGDNKLTGEIPPWLSGSFFSSMTYLILRENRFYGKIPSQLCSLNWIHVLDLSRNNLSGTIPHCFHNFTSSVKIPNPFHRGNATLVHHIVNDRIFVQWKGRESEYSKTLELLKLIDLSSNRLVGNIPKSFSTLRELISLNLSRNGLTGSIDSEINHMEMLEILDLSRNQLSGEIPVGLAQLNRLAVLDLANNKLSGKIPSGPQLQTFNESVFAGNERLCGKPLIKTCEADTDGGGESNDDEEEEGGWFMRISFMQGFGISMAFGFILGFWGVVGSLVVKKSWRYAFFGRSDAAADWMYANAILLLTKFKRRLN